MSALDQLRRALGAALRDQEPHPELPFTFAIAPYALHVQHAGPRPLDQAALPHRVDIDEAHVARFDAGLWRISRKADLRHR